MIIKYKNIEYKDYRLWTFDKNYVIAPAYNKTFCRINLYDDNDNTAYVDLYDTIDKNVGYFRDIAIVIKTCHATAGIILPDSRYKFTKCFKNLYRNHKNPKLREFE